MDTGELRSEIFDGQVAVHHTLYNDEALFHMLSTAAPGNVTVPEKRSRRCGTNKAQRNVPVTKLLYDRFKSGVDRSTKFLHSLRIFRRDAKWTVRLFRGLLGISVYNSIKIYEQHSGVQVGVLLDAARTLAMQLSEYPTSS